MTIGTITATYAAFLGIFLIILSLSVSALRAKFKISLFHDGNVALGERIRRHANFTENVPFALILMAGAESVGTNSTWLHVIGAVLVFARLLHAFGLKHDQPASPYRILGGSGTQLSMVISIIHIFLASFA